MTNFVIQYEQHIPNDEVHQVFELRLQQPPEARIAFKQGRDGFYPCLEHLRWCRLRKECSGNSQRSKSNGPTPQTTADRIHGSSLKTRRHRRQPKEPCRGPVPRAPDYRMAREATLFSNRCDGYLLSLN